MLPEKIQNKELTSQQKTFISLLFGKAQGNPKKSGRACGVCSKFLSKGCQGVKR